MAESFSSATVEKDKLAHSARCALFPSLHYSSLARHSVNNRKREVETAGNEIKCEKMDLDIGW